MGISLSKRPIEERFPEVLKQPRKSLPVRYKIEKEGFKFVPYRKNGKLWKYFTYYKNGWNEKVEFPSFNEAKKYISDALTYFSVSKDHELIEVDENGHIIVDN